MKSYKTALEQLRNEPHIAFYYGAETVFAGNLACELYMPWLSHQSFKSAFMLPKGSIYHDAIRYQIMKLSETGVLQVRRMDLIVPRIYVALYAPYSILDRNRSMATTTG